MNKFKKPNDSNKNPTSSTKHSMQSKQSSKGANNSNGKKRNNSAQRERPGPSKHFVTQQTKERPPPVSSKCTLKVTSESVRTNYPGVARMDPYINGHPRSLSAHPRGRQIGWLSPFKDDILCLLKTQHIFSFLRQAVTWH